MPKTTHIDESFILPAFIKPIYAHWLYITWHDMCASFCYDFCVLVMSYTVDSCYFITYVLHTNLDLFILLSRYFDRNTPQGKVIHSDSLCNDTPSLYKINGLWLDGRRLDVDNLYKFAPDLLRNSSQMFWYPGLFILASKYSWQSLQNVND